MKLFICLLMAAAVGTAGCSKKKEASFNPSNVSVTAIAAGARTKSGKTVDAYEVKWVENASTLLLIVGGGKLEKSGSCLLLNGRMFLFDSGKSKDAVLVVSGNRSGSWLPKVTAVDAKAKCSAGAVIDLPIDEALARSRPGMPNLR